MSAFQSDLGVVDNESDGALAFPVECSSSGTSSDRPQNTPVQWMSARKIYEDILKIHTCPVDECQKDGGLIHGQRLKSEAEASKLNNVQTQQKETSKSHSACVEGQQQRIRRWGLKI